jgi:hypothetical protein
MIREPRFHADPTRTLTKENPTLSSRMRAPFILALAVLLALLAFPSLGRAAGPQLSVALTFEPTPFQRGDVEAAVKVTVTNTGDAPTGGPVSATVELPPGLQLRDVRAGGFGSSGTCPSAQSVHEGAPLTCTTFNPLAPGESLTLMEVISVVAADAADELTTSVTAAASGVPDVTVEGHIPVIDRAPFGLAEFSARSLDSSGNDFTLAGGHPYEATTSFVFPTHPEEQLNKPVQEVRNIWIQLPPGFVGAASAAPSCPAALLKTRLFFPPCPAATRVGTVTLNTGGDGAPTYMFNVTPEKGYPAEFGFEFANNAIVSYPQLRPRGGGYGLNITVPGAGRFNIRSVYAALWGVPSQHPGLNGNPPAGGPPIPFLSNPTDCSEAEPTTRIYVDSWEHPARMQPDGTPDLTDPNWKTSAVTNPPVTGCSDPALTSQWNPTISTTPVQEGPVQANAPSGLKVNLHFEQSNDPTDPAYISGLKQYDPSIPQAPELKTATVTLPGGMAISPSGANGLNACSDQASLPQGDQVDYDSINPVTCPDASKIGTVTATSPLLAARNADEEVIGPESLSGDVYILAPHPGDLPAGGEGDGTYRLLIQIENERLGLNVKLPGVAVANKSTGQLTATFTENPQLPVKDLELEFFNGPRASLSTPKTCGTFTTTTDLEAWSAPGTPDAHPSSSFDLGAGSGCASSLSARPFNPSLSAGTTSSKAGSSTPFVLNLSRGDSEQEFSSLNVTLPPGLTAKLAGVPYCSEAAIAAAKTKSGAAEQASPSCPAASQVGTLTTSAGPGSNPYTVMGNAYLAGPYKGAPLSFAFITPAVAGPFDLGNVVVRAAAFVDPETAQVTVKTDSIPQILDGVPLGIRSIQVKVDKPDFTLNPTNCEPMAVGALVGASSGATANPQNHFQVGDCGALAFKPKLKISLKGSTAHTGHPALKAVVSYPQQGAYANIARAQVNLPHSEFLDQGSLNKTCTKPVLLEGKCPAKTIYGKARAWTPLLAAPLEGPIYLVGGYGFKLPALVAELNGQIRVVLKGKVDSGPNKGIRNTFEAVPDAPVSRFVLEMKGGSKYGLLENSEDLCKKPQRAIARFTAQNGLVDQTKPLVANSCGKKKEKAKHHKAKSRNAGGKANGKGANRALARLSRRGF